MNEDFAAAMRRALQHARAHDVMAATGVIQAALAGRTPAKRQSAKAPVDITPQQRAVPMRGGLTASNTDTDQGARCEKIAAPDAKFFQSRQRRPLGEVVSALQRLRKSGMSGLRARPATSPSPDVPDGAQFPARRFRCAAGERIYKLYVPSGLAGSPRGLIVMLHGCTQDPDDFAYGTHMNAHAESHGLLIAYPEQSLKENVSSCWNWFRPEDQRRGAGEPAILAGLTRAIADEVELTPEKTFIAGFSAGGAMAEVMLATHPELYAAGCIHSGLAYRSAGDVVSALAAMRGQGERCGIAANTGPAPGSRKIIFHGSRDAIVHPSNADRIFAAAHAGIADTQHHVERVSGGRGGSYVRSTATTPQGESIAEYWLVEGAGHAWSGGRNGASYTDPGGPDASAEMIRFFLNHT